MENKINIAELLKDCPQGMELDCTMYDNVTLSEVDLSKTFPILLLRGNKERIVTTEYGQYQTTVDSKCIIFPKGKTTWEGFVPPCKFKDGDIINKGDYITIVSYIEPNGLVWYYCWYDMHHKTFKVKNDYGIGRINDGDKIRFATEEEKEKLFDAIKANGYKWNAETKTLEKLPKFKVGDKIVQKNSACTAILITKVGDEFYYSDTESSVGVLPISEQDDWELVPDKFDIKTLVPFESRVLVRDTNGEKWKSNFWGFYDNDHAMNYPHECCGNTYSQCIPYEGNEHLLGKTDDCDDFYKTWE